MKKIIQRRSVPKESNLPETFHPVIRRILAARDINEASELDYGLQNIIHYASLSGIEAAVTLLSEALMQQARILIIADYDVDGATSCVLAIQALKQMGAKQIGYLVPNREKQGYGLSSKIVELAQTESFLAETRPHSAPDLLITVDNGISSHQGVQTAKQYGMRVLITDHHLAPEQLPEADAIVNPNQPGDAFPSKNLCGVGVIFYVMMALRSYLRDQGWFTAQGLPEPNLAQFLDLVALGTVADVVPLDYNNRVFVEQGLRRIRANQCCPGIQALLRVSGREPQHIVANDLAFYVGPRLNAAGRMDDMSYGIACLLSEDNVSALRHAEILQTFNQERRFVESEMQQEALDQLDQLGDIDNLPIGLCLFDPHWHQGVIGILAARMKDRLHRPVIVFTQANDHLLKGSARSVPGVHIRDVLENIAIQYPDMLEKFGGHAMAAGLSLPQTQLELFQQAFDVQVRRYLAVDKLRGVIETDGSLSGHDLNLELAEQLRTMTPWGQNFPEPIFDGEFELLERRVLKNKHLKMQVRPLDSDLPLDVIAFNTVDTHWPTQVSRIQLAYKLEVNLFRGFRNLQLMAEYVALSES